MFMKSDEDLEIPDSDSKELHLMGSAVQISSSDLPQTGHNPMDSFANKDFESIKMG